MNDCSFKPNIRTIFEKCAESGWCRHVFSDKQIMFALVDLLTGFQSLSEFQNRQSLDAFFKFFGLASLFQALGSSGRA